jgi:hypothetical protein
MATIPFNILITNKIGIKVNPMLKFNSIRRANNRTSAEKTGKIWIIHTMRFLRRNQRSFQISAKSILLSQKCLADLANA